MQIQKQDEEVTLDQRQNAVCSKKLRLGVKLQHKKTNEMDYIPRTIIPPRGWKTPK